MAIMLHGAGPYRTAVPLVSWPAGSPACAGRRPGNMTER